MSAPGGGLMLSGGTDRDAAAWTARHYVRGKVLEVIPGSKDKAVTAVQIAVRADMTPEAVRPHMVRLRASGEVLRVGSGSGIDPYRYFTPNGQAPDEQLEESAAEVPAAPDAADGEICVTSDEAGGPQDNDEQEEADVSEETTSDRVRAALPTSNTEALTVAEIADRAGVSVTQATSVLVRMFKTSEADRVGKGGRHDPYRYFDSSYDVPAKQGRRPKALSASGTSDYDDVVAQLEDEAEQLEEKLDKVRAAIAALENLRGAA